MEKEEKWIKFHNRWNNQGHEKDENEREKNEKEQKEGEGGGA